MAPKKALDPIHPGEILFEEFMKPMDISINRLARAIAVPPGRISAIVNGKHAITADTALRLGKYFGVSAELCSDSEPISISEWPNAESDLRSTSKSTLAWRDASAPS